MSSKDLGSLYWKLLSSSVSPAQTSVRLLRRAPKHLQRVATCKPLQPCSVHRHHYHATTTRPLRHEERDASGKGQQSKVSSTDGESIALSADDVKQIEQGSHPWLERPIEEQVLNSLIVSDFRAPNCGVIRNIRLNEPKAFNALSKSMLAELSDQIDAIHNEPAPGHTRVLVISSESEKAFCAGANLKERANMSLDEANAFLARLRQTFARIADLPVPVIAAVHGVALGGGLELALTAHLRIASAAAVLGLPETTLGIIPGAGGTHRLPALVGRSRALELMLAKKNVSGSTAALMGLCNEAVEHGGGEARHAVRTRGMALAGSIALRAPLAVRAVMQATSGGGSQEQENAAYDTVIKTHDRNEALAAFREKRPPVFRGQ